MLLHSGGPQRLLASLAIIRLLDSCSLQLQSGPHFQTYFEKSVSPTNATPPPLIPSPLSLWILALIEKANRNLISPNEDEWLKDGR